MSTHANTHVNELHEAYRRHLANVQLLQQKLPALSGETLRRAHATIDNLRNQMISIDTQLLRYSAGMETSNART